MAQSLPEHKEVVAASATPQDVLSYWFGTGDPWSNARRWSTASTAADEEVERRFGPTIEAALRGELDDWSKSPTGTVALVLVLDQFTRSAYRDDPRCFSGDERARKAAVAALEKEWPVHHRYFLLMPLMHAEDREAQRLSVAEFADLWREDPKNMTQSLDAAVDHANIVLRFGRFPDRNALLGRTSTPDEVAFLERETRSWFEVQ